MLRAGKRLYVRQTLQAREVFMANLSSVRCCQETLLSQEYDYRLSLRRPPSGFIMKTFTGDNSSPSRLAHPSMIKDSGPELPSLSVPP